jgi:hypothetical protein
MVHIEEFYPSDAYWRERLVGMDENPLVCLMVNEQADKEVIGALCPDLIFGDWGGRNGQSPPTVQLLDLYGQVGYERTIALLKRIDETFSQKTERYENGSL